MSIRQQLQASKWYSVCVGAPSLRQRERGRETGRCCRGWAENSNVSHVDASNHKSGFDKSAACFSLSAPWRWLPGAGEKTRENETTFDILENVLVRCFQVDELNKQMPQLHRIHVVAPTVCRLFGGEQGAHTRYFFRVFLWTAPCCCRKQGRMKLSNKSADWTVKQQTEIRFKSRETEGGCVFEWRDPLHIITLFSNCNDIYCHMKMLVVHRFYSILHPSFYNLKKEDVLLAWIKFWWGYHFQHLKYCLCAFSITFGFSVICSIFFLYLVLLIHSFNFTLFIQPKVPFPYEKHMNTVQKQGY